MVNLGGGTVVGPRRTIEEMSWPEASPVRTWNSDPDDGREAYE